MTYRQVETSREIRLWITQVIIPMFGIAMMIPEAREAVVAKTKELKDTVKENFK